MGTDRYEIHRGLCPCGSGELVVVECEPDHMYARPHQRTWETNVACPECHSEYALAVQDGHVVLVRRDDLAARRAAKDGWHDRNRRLAARHAVRAAKARLVEKLSGLPSKAAIRHLLRDAGFSVGSKSTFYRHWTDPASWVEKNVTTARTVEHMFDALGQEPGDLADEIAETHALWQASEAKLPVVGDPLVRVSGSRV